MKKLIFFLLGFLALIVIFIQVITVLINEEITQADLPESAYQTSNPFNAAHSALMDYFNQSDEDDYSSIETFMNYMIYDAIKDNINSDYDPLSETCETDACKYIIATDHVVIDYAFARLNDEDQIVLTVSLKRFNYPSVETAVHLVFDLSVNQTAASFTLTLNHARIADRVISERILDTVMGYVDKEAIEDSITYGTLDLDNYTYTASLLDLTMNNLLPLP